LAEYCSASIVFGQIDGSRIIPIRFDVVKLICGFVPLSLKADNTKSAGFPQLINTTREPSPVDKAMICVIIDWVRTEDSKWEVTEMG
jgi:hypothetical protein